MPGTPDAKRGAARDPGAPADGPDGGPRSRGRTAVGVLMLALAVFGLVVFLLPFAFPTPPPIVTRFAATRLFSPDGDRARDVARVSVRMREAGSITLEVTSGDDVIRTLAEGRPSGRGWHRFTWDGRDAAGDRVEDGDYALRLRARAGRKVFNTSRRIRVDSSAPALAAMTTSPPPADATGPTPECLVEITPADDAAVVLEALSLDGRRALRRLGPRPVPGGQTLRWGWDGRGADGPAATGLHVVRAVLTDPARNATVVARTCWIGHLVGGVEGRAPRPGDLVRLRLRRPDGTPLRPDGRVRLQLHRRTGTPGGDGAVLGRRVARPVVTRVRDAAIRLPRTRRTDALWVVARVPARDGLPPGRALIPLGPRP